MAVKLNSENDCVVGELWGMLTSRVMDQGRRVITGSLCPKDWGGPEAGKLK